MSIKLRNRLAANRFRIPDAGAVPAAPGISKLVHPLHPLLSPASVALVGASERPGSLGQVVLANLRKGGFRGPIHLVNPRYESLDGAPFAKLVWAAAQTSFSPVVQRSEKMLASAASTATRASTPSKRYTRPPLQPA